MNQSTIFDFFPTQYLPAGITPIPIRRTFTRARSFPFSPKSYCFKFLLVKSDVALETSYMEFCGILFCFHQIEQGKWLLEVDLGEEEVPPVWSDALQTLKKNYAYS